MDELVSSVDHLTLDRYICVVGATIWVYDYVLTITDEVTLVWSRKISLVKVLYLTNRYICVPYITLMMYYLLGTLQGSPEQTATSIYNQSSPKLRSKLTLGPHSCRFIDVGIVILRQTEVLAATWLIMMRVIVLFSRVKWVKWVLYAAFIVTHVVTNALMVEVVKVFYPNMLYIVPLRLCVSATPELTKVLYFLQIPFEILLFGFLLFHNWQYNRTIITPANIKPSPLLSALYMDGLLYFVATIAARVWAGCIIVLLPETYWYMTIVVDVSLSSVFISRIFLHLSKVSDTSSNTTMASTNAGPRKPSANVYPNLQMPAHIHEGDSTTPADSIKYDSHHGGRHDRISWTEMGRMDGSPQQRKYNSRTNDI